jgi:hypothetical protein
MLPLVAEAVVRASPISHGVISQQDCRIEITWAFDESIYRHSMSQELAERLMLWYLSPGRLIAHVATGGGMTAHEPSAHLSNGETWALQDDGSGSTAG